MAQRIRRKLSEFISDSEHRTVSDTEKTTWSNPVVTPESMGIYIGVDAPAEMKTYSQWVVDKTGYWAFWQLADGGAVGTLVSSSSTSEVVAIASSFTANTTAALASVIGVGEASAITSSFTAGLVGTLVSVVGTGETSNVTSTFTANPSATLSQAVASAAGSRITGDASGNVSLTVVPSSADSAAAAVTGSFTANYSGTVSSNSATSGSVVLAATATSNMAATLAAAVASSATSSVASTFTVNRAGTISASASSSAAINLSATVVPGSSNASATVVPAAATSGSVAVTGSVPAGSTEEGTYRFNTDMDGFIYVSETNTVPFTRATTGGVDNSGCLNATGTYWEYEGSETVIIAREFLTSSALVNNDTFSFYFKKVSNYFVIDVIIRDGVRARKQDISSEGTVLSSTEGGLSATIENKPDGWKKCTFTVVNSGNVADATLPRRLRLGISSVPPTNDGESSTCLIDCVTPPAGWS